MRLVLEKSLNLTWPCLYESCCILPKQSKKTEQIRNLTMEHLMRVYTICNKTIIFFTHVTCYSNELFCNLKDKCGKMFSVQIFRVFTVGILDPFFWTFFFFPSKNPSLKRVMYGWKSGVIPG